MHAIAGRSQIAAASALDQLGFIAATEQVSDELVTVMIARSVPFLIGLPRWCGTGTTWPSRSRTTAHANHDRADRTESPIVASVQRLHDTSTVAAWASVEPYRHSNG
jgi:hypothetical protein